MKNRKQYIDEFLKEFSFPSGTAEEFNAAYQRIHSIPEADEIFEQQLSIYENDFMFDFYGMLTKIKEAINLSGVREEPAYMMFVVCLTQHLRKLMENKKLPFDLFEGVALDIKAKNDECYNVRGVYGTFVQDWFGRFFNLTRFAIGRLQFEPRYLPEDLDLGDIKLAKGTFCIGIHIPSGRPLNPEKCEESLKRAYDMFLPCFKNNTVIFHCASWMLAPAHRKLLKPDSNLIKFMDMFYRLVPTGKTFQHDFWRIFNTDDYSDVSKLPQDNSLRRTYARIIESGNYPESGKGIIVVKDREIVK